MTQLAIGFDYAALDADTRALVTEARDRIKVLERTTGEAIIEIGRQLIAVKASLPHGQFEPWMEVEFGWSYDTARRFMKVATVFGEKTQIASFQPSALYALASGTVPDTIREEFIERADAGEPVRYQDVKRRLAEHQALRVVDTETGEVVGTLEPDEPAGEPAAAHALTWMPSPPQPTVADLPPSRIPELRAPTDEERIYDSLSRFLQATTFDPEAVAEAAVTYRYATAKDYPARAAAFTAWHRRVVDAIERRLNTPLRAIR
jgi:hypothetical protein